MVICIYRDPADSSLEIWRAVTEFHQLRLEIGGHSISKEADNNIGVLLGVGVVASDMERGHDDHRKIL